MIRPDANQPPDVCSDCGPDCPDHGEFSEFGRNGSSGLWIGVALVLFVGMAASILAVGVVCLWG